VLSGVLAAALVVGVQLVQDLAFGVTTAVPTLLVVPAVGGLLVGLLTRYWVPEAAGGGVTQVMTGIALQGGRMRPVVALGKLITSALSLGTGASGGREGPIVQIGGAVGSTLGRLLALSEDDMPTLIAAGAGAGIAASFNAPLSGIFFAIEIVVGGFRIHSLQTIVLTCVLASVTARELIGSAITYQFERAPRFTDPRELPLYVLLGLAAVVAGLAYSRGEHLVAERVARWRLWSPLGPAAGLLLVLAVAKVVATCLSIGTGNSVGSFAPAVFIGAALGVAFGHVAQLLLPGGEGIQPGGFALVGMAALLGSSVRAPLTGILLAFELTNDYGMVLPLMLATGVATFVADRVDADSIYTLPLRRRGIVYAEPGGRGHPADRAGRRGHDHRRLGPC
jgi:CIC family chloride channel protein